MNDKNTLDNKARFFVQYINQRVAFWSNNGESNLVLNSISNLGRYHLRNKTLLLKTLDKISDEQAIEVAIIFDLDQAAIDEMGHEGLIQWIEALFDESAGYYIDGYRGDQLLEMIDYLRRNSFLISFDGITVDELLSFGWAKIQE